MATVCAPSVERNNSNAAFSLAAGGTRQILVYLAQDTCPAATVLDVLRTNRQNYCQLHPLLNKDGKQASLLIIAPESLVNKPN